MKWTTSNTSRRAALPSLFRRPCVRPPRTRPSPLPPRPPGQRARPSHRPGPAPRRARSPRGSGPPSPRGPCPRPPSRLAQTGVWDSASEKGRAAVNQPPRGPRGPPGRGGMEGATEARLALLEAACAELAATRAGASAREARARSGAARLEEKILVLDREVRRVREAAAEEARVREAVAADWAGAGRPGWKMNPSGAGRGRAAEFRPGGGLLTFGRRPDAVLRVVPPQIPRREAARPRPEYGDDVRRRADREKREWRELHERRLRGRAEALADSRAQAAAELRRAGEQRRREKREARARARRSAEADLEDVRALIEELRLPKSPGAFRRSRLAAQGYRSRASTAPAAGLGGGASKEAGAWRAGPKAGA